MKKRAKDILNDVVDLFKDDKHLPEAITIMAFPKDKNKPSYNWSLSNRMIMYLNDTFDARTFKQWKKVGRYPKKGSKAFYILAPNVIKIEDKDSGEEKTVVAGFRTIPVFRFEDTGGKSLVEETEKISFPLKDKAEELGVNVEFVPGNEFFYGCFDGESIQLATKEVKTFFHELAHAVDNKVNGKLKGGQVALQEITAELTAIVLCKYFNTEKDYSGYSFKYIEGYAKKSGKSVEKACMAVLKNVSNILNYLVDK